jgi:hypothetical protein
LIGFNPFKRTETAQSEAALSVDSPDMERAPTGSFCPLVGDVIFTPGSFDPDGLEELVAGMLVCWALVVHKRHY